MKNVFRFASLILCAAVIFASCKATVEYKDKVVEKEVVKEVEKKGDTVAPAAITNLAATAKDSRVLLTWTDAADNDIYGYEVSYTGTNAINRAVAALDNKSMIAPQGAGGCYVSGLTNDTEYTFTVKTVDTSGNKSAGVTVKATPKAVSAGETLQISLAAAVPHENGYTGNKSNTKVTVTVNITTASNVKKVVWKKNGSVVARTLLADTDAAVATVTDDNAVWSFDITATDESANGTYTVAAIDDAGREESEQITINHFDFTPPGRVGITNTTYSSQLACIILNWKEPDDTDYDHVIITYTYKNSSAIESDVSSPVNVVKGTTDYTLTNIEATTLNYTFTLISVDELGNKGKVKKYQVAVSGTALNCPVGFVEVSGATVSGAINESRVFIENRTVTIPDMYVCDHEVTQGEYETYCYYGFEKPNSANGKGVKFPVYYVSWYDAIVYCNLLSKAENLDPVYSINSETDPTKWDGIESEIIDGVTKYRGPSSENTVWNSLVYNTSLDGYRLLTEAEWEYVAREENTSTTTYSGSNLIDDVAWYSGNSGYKSHEVKGKNANVLGVYDMSGNVWEWCYDSYDDIYATTPDTGPDFRCYRILRGGNYYSSYGASCCSVFYCNYTAPYERNMYSSGFRVVRTAQ